MSLWLDADELIELTGYKRRQEQRDALTQMGIKFRSRPADGYPLVNRAVFLIIAALLYFQPASAGLPIECRTDTSAPSCAALFDRYAESMDEPRKEPQEWHPTALYRHWNDEGALLYVGISWQIMHRTRAHERTSYWFHQVTKITVSWYATRDDARAAELLAIRTERPVHNKMDRRDS